ncbi:MAG: tetratricopeptide repeat protein, partial [Acidobacteriota bacterium]
GALERFKREILLASRVTHKNVLRIHDLGESGDVKFISMHYVDGDDLKELLREKGALPLERGLRLTRQICEALQAAHEAGVVHRDLKPQNILLDRDDNAYIADFGISRSLEAGATMTETGTVLGTVDYMSPEQARGETADHRSDIYSLGVMLYEMFTGQLPFRSDNPLSVMMKRIHEDAPTVRQVRAAIPVWLSAIVSRAMQRDREVRYQSVAELIRDLDRHRAAIAWRRFLRPRVLARAGAAALLLVAAVAIALYFLRPGPAGVPVPQTSLAVLPFENATGDARYDWIRSGLPNLLRTDLLQARTLRLVGEERVQGILEGLNIAETGDFRPATLQRVANLMGVENMVTGNLMKAGSQFRIEASVLQVGASSISPGAPIRVEGKGEESLFTMVDELTRLIREELGVAKGWLEADRSATDLSTGSVEALRLYNEALARARAGKNHEAARKSEAALEEDAEFVGARAFLAETYDRLGYTDRARGEAEKAARGLRDASPYEAAKIRAVRARLGNDLEAAEKAYQKLCEISPHSAEAHLNLASVQEDNGELKKALGTLHRVIDLDSKHAEAHFALGRVQFMLGNPTEALTEFNITLGLHLELGNDQGRATVLNGLGNTYDLLGRQDEALNYYQQSLKINREIGDQRGVSVALMNLASTHRLQGHSEQAIESAKEAIAIGQKIGNPAGLSDGYSTLGEIYEESGRTDEALKYYQESLKIARELGDDAALARDYTSIGYINYVLGRYLEAFFFHKEALAKRRQIGDKEDIIESLVTIGIVEQVQGRYEEAIEFYLEALSLARELGDVEQVAVISANLSNIHEDQGEYGTALALLSEAETTARQLNDMRLTATSLAYLGSTRRHQGDYAGAEEALAEALRLARQIHNRPLVAEILTYQGQLEIARGRTSQAAAILQEAASEAEAAKQHRLGLIARLNAAEAGRSVRDLEAILGEAQSAGLAPLEAPARLALAQIHLGARQHERALEEAERTIEAATPLLQRDLLFQAHHLAGKCLRRQGKAEAALDHFSAALAVFEELVRSLKEDPLAHFLGRSETSEFAKDAKELFKSANRPSEQERLNSLLRS